MSIVDIIFKIHSFHHLCDMIANQLSLITNCCACYIALDHIQPFEIEMGLDEAWLQQLPTKYCQDWNPDVHFQVKVCDANLDIDVFAVRQRIKDTDDQITVIIIIVVFLLKLFSASNVEVDILI